MSDPLTIAKGGLEWIAAGVHNPQFVAQTTLEEIGRARENDAINAAQKLANEVQGMLGINEVAYRQLMGNTNYEVLKARLEEFKVLLANNDPKPKG